MPHTWDHQDLTKMQIDEAKANIDKCVDYFNSNLDGFVASESVYNFAYNASTPELLDYVLSIFRAARTGGWDLPGNKKSNPFPHSGKPRCLGCWSFGPDNADDWVDKEVNEFLSGPGGWLILNLHGLDEEGWGPIQSSFLQVLLDKLVKIDYLDILPVGMALKKYAF
jgi:peptidoglycan/xylan/chitin deacetylase (PgdA/CDA1 family)